ncbi:MAG: transcription-repair coupling factor [Bacteriovoracaceae bacterium]|nr:transcription-repair coupling factor [Bacteriovoracaceae bacterium]
MSHFNSLLQKIINWDENSSSPLNLYGASTDQWSFIFNSFLRENANLFLKKSQLIITSSNDEAEDFYNSLQPVVGSKMVEVLFYPGLEASLYSGVISSEKNFYDRLEVLSRLNRFNFKQNKFILITSFEALSLKTPPRSFFNDHSFELKTDDIISPFDLAKKLVAMGYSSATSVEEPGTFIQKGQIFDIFPVGAYPVRLSYFDDLIETIFPIDLETQKTLRESPVEKVCISPAAGILAQGDFSVTLRENLPQPGPAFKNKFEFRKALFNRLSDGLLFENYPAYLPLFFKHPGSLLDYFPFEDTLTFVLNSNQTNRAHLEFVEMLRTDFENTEINLNSENILPEFHKIYNFDFISKLESQKTILVNQLNLNMSFGEMGDSVDLRLVKTKTFLNEHINPTLSKPDYIIAALDFIKKHFQFQGRLFFSSYSDSSRQEIQHLIELQNYPTDLKNRISFLPFRVSEGFYYESENFLIITDGDLFAAKKSKVQKHKKVDLDLFAEQLSTLKVGDYVIHSEYGVGVYAGLESLDIAGDKSDFLVLKYAESDKVYVPVYKLNLIQKHADATAGLKSDSLRTNKFQALKARARNSAKILAFDLLKLQAERQSSSAYAFSPPDHLYKEFELAFPFEETPDQARAIEDVLECMQKPVPMDYLVCGDVGFGKTEVAMRAAFKAVEDKKQVAILVPTTILALQHFNSFTKRFKEFPVRIEFISRFKSAKESKEILEKTARGEVDILIGTHKLLSDKLKFSDLGLVIVDEEQRFGVGHKEKLKLMKASVDFLTLTATPIPRTLQMAFLGLRDLSLIKTPPPRRQSIKTYVIKEDELTIQAAIQKELQRGGQVFLVHNKVHDIEDYAASIRELVPEAKITFAHGQMGERELEDRINSFYNGTYQVLIATTIIESGIDIPNANTMIIDRADTYGLAQLHQLRGRIGRSDKKAYAYLVVPRMREISEIAQKRLHALQTYADMGSGFNIASVDLEIRGAGDILGATQSGHVEAVGLELYMELLKDAIHELRGERKLIKKDIEIITPFPAFIPNHYIKDAGERLKQYKRLSNCETQLLLENIREEFQDVYGVFSEELSNLFTVLETRIQLQTLGLKSVQVGGSAITLKFDKQYLESNSELRDKVVNFFISRPKIYQFTPDYRVIYNHKTSITQNDLLKFSKDIGGQLSPT